MTPQDYDYLRKLLKDRSGLVLSADKQYLVESRLVPLARKAGLGGISDLVQKMKNGAETLTVDVVEAMTTNETFFFRDKVPFDHFQETIIPTLLRARANRKTLRIWCAAGSTGQDSTWLHWSLPAIFSAVRADPLNRIVWSLRGRSHRTSPRFAR